MTDTVIRVENLGKKYLLEHQRGPRERYHALRDVLAGSIRSLAGRLCSPFRKTRPAAQKRREEFWALRDVCFEVKRGDVLGVIGRNGAGKSTLLKILSRITEPTTGRVTIDGRLASLLEVGTGFHPELSGRENIYLNGAILGMSRKEIRRKFDEIVAFAEIEKFLDMPVKRYSSGMYVRLAFAVAAHLEPEILVVDEVLAVGDAAFQKKCLGKMNEVASSGRTVLFVSHNMSAVANLCTRGVVLDRGGLVSDTNIQKAIGYYLDDDQTLVREERRKDDAPSIVRVALDPTALQQGCLEVTVDFVSSFPFNPVVGIVLYTRQGQPLFGTNPELHGGLGVERALREGRARLTIQDLPLFSGVYKLSVWLGDDHRVNHDMIQDALTFDFVSSTVLPAGLSTEVIGPFNVAARWELLDFVGDENAVPPLLSQAHP